MGAQAELSPWERKSLNWGEATDMWLTMRSAATVMSAEREPMSSQVPRRGSTCMWSTGSNPAVGTIEGRVEGEDVNAAKNAGKTRAHELSDSLQRPTEAVGVDDQLRPPSARWRCPLLFQGHPTLWSAAAAPVRQRRSRPAAFVRSGRCGLL